MAAGQSTVIGVDYPFEQPILKGLGPVNAQDIVRMSGIPVSTLNVWANRKIIPWLKTDQAGRQRRFDIQLSLHLALTGTLVRLGYDVARASSSAINIIRAKDLSATGTKAVITNELNPEFPGMPNRREHIVGSFEEIQNITRDAEAFIVVDIEQILQRVIQTATATAERPTARDDIQAANDTARWRKARRAMARRILDEDGNL